MVGPLPVDYLNSNELALSLPKQKDHSGSDRQYVERGPCLTSPNVSRSTLELDPEFDPLLDLWFQWFLHHWLLLAVGARLGLRQQD